MASGTGGRRKEKGKGKRGKGKYCGDCLQVSLCNKLRGITIKFEKKRKEKARDVRMDGWM